METINAEIVKGPKNLHFSPFDILDFGDQDKRLGGKFHLEITHADGTTDIVDITNTVVNEGKNKLLDVMFHSATQITSWYIGLMDSSGYSANPATDAAASHSGWTESTAYSESVRQTWSAGSPASQSITNATPASFSINGTATLKGIFIISNSTKGGSTGTLWSSGTFTSDLPVVNGDTLKITYTLSC